MATSDERARELERENEKLRRELERSRKREQELLREQERLKRDGDRLRRKIAELSRAAKRQAAPFARRERKAQRRKPGAKTGHRPAWRKPPERVEQTVQAPLPECPHCGGEVDDVKAHEQFVVDLPKVEPVVTRVVTHSGHCAQCKRRVRSKHPAQVSNAGGAAAVSLGARALGLAADLKHRQGMPYRDVAQLFGRYFGLRVTHGALAHSTKRLARRGRATYASLGEHVRSDSVVHTDDTGWRIDGESAWLWTFATSRVTYYRIEHSRGADVVTSVLGNDFAGTLVSDGLPALDSLRYRRAQCLSHALRRASELVDVQTAGAVRMPLAIKRILRDAIALRAERAALSEHSFACRRAAVERQLTHALRNPSRVADNERFRKHLLAHRDQWLRCLYDPEVEPTNNLAERELRGAVVIRKMGGCNRSPAHAKAHAVLATVAQTAHRNGITLTDFVETWLQPRDGPWDEVEHAMHPLTLLTPSRSGAQLRS